MNDERAAERLFTVPRRYIQHEVPCDLRMRMGAKCSCGLADYARDHLAQSTDERAAS